MIESIRMENFQCHKDLSVVFDEHITSIVGTTDSGKSAILRAIRWICTNRPGGLSFIRRGGGICSVSLQVDGSTITRSRGREINICKHDGRTYKAFGTDVPPSILSLFNLGEVNWQQQHDPPFWFTLSPGEVSRELNSIINLGEIDQVLSLVASKIRISRGEEDAASSRLEDARKRAGELDWVEKADEDLSRIESRLNRIEERRMEKERLGELLGSIKKYYFAVRRYKKASRDHKRLLNKIIVYDRLRSDFELLTSITQEWDRLEDRSCWMKAGLSHAKEEIQILLEKQCPLCGTLRPSQFRTST